MPEIPVYQAKMEVTGTLDVPLSEIQRIEDAVNVILSFIQDMDREYLVSLYVNGTRILGVEVIAIGSSTQATTSIRELIRGAILVGATGVILAHNHPLSSITPSEADIQMTKSFQRAANLHGIDLLGSFVVNNDGAYTNIMDKLEHEVQLVGKDIIKEIIRVSEENSTGEKVSFYFKIITKIITAILAFLFLGNILYDIIHDYQNYNPYQLSFYVFLVYILVMVANSSFSIKRKYWPRVKRIPSKLNQNINEKTSKIVEDYHEENL